MQIAAEHPVAAVVLAHQAFLLQEGQHRVAGNSAWGRPDLLEHRVWRSMVEVNLMGTVHVIEPGARPVRWTAKQRSEK